MKVSELAILAGGRRKKIQYSKDLPYYGLLQLSRLGVLLGLVAFIGFLISGSDNSIWLTTCGALLFPSSLLYGIVIFLREEKHDHGK